MPVKRKAKKRAKCETEAGGKPGNVDLTGFTVEKCLCEAESKKSVTLLGTFNGKKGQAIVTLTRSHFPSSNPDCTDLIRSLKTRKVFDNDIFTQYTGAPSENYNHINVSVIHPCAKHQIRAYSEQCSFTVCETYKMYKKLTQPFIRALPTPKWIVNILKKKSEANRIIFEDKDPAKGFILLPDFKWDQFKVENMHCIAIVKRHDLRCLRDLRESDLPLLRNILDRGREAVCKHYSLCSTAVRVLLHYLPSCYHLHVHFIHIDMGATEIAAAGRAHMLEDVISNLTICGDFYAKAALTCVLRQDSALGRILQSSGKPAAGGPAKKHALRVHDSASKKAAGQDPTLQDEDEATEQRNSSVEATSQGRKRGASEMETNIGAGMKSKKKAKVASFDSQVNPKKKQKSAAQIVKHLCKRAACKTAPGPGLKKGASGVKKKPQRVGKGSVNRKMNSKKKNSNQLLKTEANEV